MDRLFKYLAFIAILFLCGITWQNYLDKQIASPKQKAAKAADEPPSDVDDWLLEAKSMCEQVVTEHLKSPSSAAFSEKSELSKTIGKNTYKVTGYLDAQNIYGANLRSDFMCNLKYIGKNKDGDKLWHTNDLMLSEPTIWSPYDVHN